MTRYRTWRQFYTVNIQRPSRSYQCSFLSLGITDAQKMCSKYMNGCMTGIATVATPKQLPRPIPGMVGLTKQLHHLQEDGRRDGVRLIFSSTFAIL